MNAVFDKKPLSLALQPSRGHQIRQRLSLAALTTLLSVGSVGVAAQADTEPMLALEEVVVTARRKDD